MPPKTDTAKLDAIMERLEANAVTLATVATDVKGIKETITALQENVKANSDGLATLRREFDDFKEETHYEVRNLKTSFNNREQVLRGSTVRLFNIPAYPDEQANNFANLSAKLYGRIFVPILTAAVAAGDLPAVPHHLEAVEACYRAFVQVEPTVGQSPPPVVIRLRSKAIKIALLKHRRLHMPQPSENEKARGARRFVLVEDLTPPAHKLLKALQADPRTDKVWSVNGLIHFSLPNKTGYKKVRSVFDSVDDILS